LTLEYRKAVEEQGLDYRTFEAAGAELDRGTSFADVGHERKSAALTTRPRGGVPRPFERLDRGPRTSARGPPVIDSQLSSLPTRAFAGDLEEVIRRASGPPGLERVMVIPRCRQHEGGGAGGTGSGQLMGPAPAVRSAFTPTTRIGFADDPEGARESDGGARSSPRRRRPGRSARDRALNYHYGLLAARGAAGRSSAPRFRLRSSSIGPVRDPHPRGGRGVRWRFCARKAKGRLRGSLALLHGKRAPLRDARGSRSGFYISAGPGF